MLDLTEVDLDGVLSQKWEDKQKSVCCGVCEKPWTLFSGRRHHCRGCGNLVCQSCCAKSVVLDHQQGVVSACTPCYTVLSALLQEHQHLIDFFDNHYRATTQEATPSQQNTDEEAEKTEKELKEVKSFATSDDDDDDQQLFGSVNVGEFSNNTRRSRVPELGKLSDLADAPHILEHSTTPQFLRTQIFNESIYSIQSQSHKSVNSHKAAAQLNSVE
eukprot:gene17315-19736_t